MHQAPRAVPIRMLGILLDVVQVRVELDAEHIDELCQQNQNLQLLLQDQQIPVMMNDKSGVDPVDGGRDGVYHDPLDI